MDRGRILKGVQMLNKETIEYIEKTKISVYGKEFKISTILNKMLELEPNPEEETDFTSMKDAFTDIAMNMAQEGLLQSGKKEE